MFIHWSVYILEKILLSYVNKYVVYCPLVYVKRTTATSFAKPSKILIIKLLEPSRQ